MGTAIGDLVKEIASEPLVLVVVSQKMCLQVGGQSGRSEKWCYHDWSKLWKVGAALMKVLMIEELLYLWVAVRRLMSTLMEESLSHLVQAEWGIGPATPVVHVVVSCQIRLKPVSPRG